MSEIEPNRARITAVAASRAFPSFAAVRWLVNVVYAGLLVFLAVIPPSPEIRLFAIPDQLAHALAYGGQACLIYWAMVRRSGHCAANIAAFSGAVTFGLMTEGLQLLQPARSVEVGDLVANAFGAAATCGLILMFRAMSARETG